MHSTSALSALALLRMGFMLQVKIMRLHPCTVSCGCLWIHAMLLLLFSMHMHIKLLLKAAFTQVLDTKQGVMQAS
jgi:hypothetical protein